MKKEKMRILSSNTEKLEQELKSIQGRARTNTLTAGDIGRILNSIKIPKSRLDGTKIEYTGAYKYENNGWALPGTQFQAENKNGKWYIIDIYRKYVPNRNSGEIEFDFSDTAKNWIKANISELIH